MLFNTEVIGAKGGVIPLKLSTNLLLLMKNQKFWETKLIQMPRCPG